MYQGYPITQPHQTLILAGSNCVRKVSTGDASNKKLDMSIVGVHESSFKEKNLQPETEPLPDPNGASAPYKKEPLTETKAETLSDTSSIMV